CCCVVTLSFLRVLFVSIHIVFYCALLFSCCLLLVRFFFYDSASTEIYTLSLHDALPISNRRAEFGQWWFARAAAYPRAPSARRSDRKSTRLNSSHVKISYAVFCLKKKKREY